MVKKEKMYVNRSINRMSFVDGGRDHKSRNVHASGSWKGKETSLHWSLHKEPDQLTPWRWSSRIDGQTPGLQNCK